MSEISPAVPSGQVLRTAVREEGRRHASLRRFLANRLAVIGVCFLVLVICVAIFAPVLTTVSPDKVDLSNIGRGPSDSHWLGTDRTGRDVWSRVVYGARISVSVGFGAVAIYTFVGLVLGCAAGYFGGLLDMVVARCADIVLSFPVVVFMMVALSVLGSGLVQLIVLLGLMGWPPIARLVRGECLGLRELDFIVAARSMGVSSFRIIVRHVVPNVVGVTMVAATLGVAVVVLVEASLSFLGLGIQPPTPSWGNMLTSAQSLNVLRSMPWLWAPPGLMIFLTILSINFVGDGLRDALDPRAKER